MAGKFLLLKHSNVLLCISADLKTTTLLFALAILGPVALGAAENDLTQTENRLKGWRSDIDFLQTAVVREHYLFRTESLPKDFVKLAEELKGRVAELSDLRMLVEFQHLMATLGDGHCYATPTPKFIQRLKGPPQELPLRLHGFSNGLFVIDANPGFEAWIGRQITRIGSLSADQAWQRVTDYIPKDNRHGGRWLGPVFLGYHGYLEAIGCIGKEVGEVTLGFTSADGKESVASVGFAPMQNKRPPLIPSRLPGAAEAPLHLRQVTSNYWFEAIPNREAVYVQFNQTLNSPNEALEAFAARLDRELQESRPKLLGIDVRYNGGGNADLLPPLLRVIREFKAREPGGKVVVLIGPGTLSAAQIFVSKLDRGGEVIFAGEPSGSKPNFVGEHNPVELPWSGVTVNISNRRHEIIPGDTRQWIEPELKVEMSSTDYFANRDPVWESVLVRYAAPAKSRN
jgi:hypothetical protein